MHAYHGSRIKYAILGVALLLTSAGITGAAIPSLRDRMMSLLGFAKAGLDAAKKGSETPAELIFDADGHAGVRLSKDVAAGLKNMNPQAVTPATARRELPPQIGTVNYDNDRLFTIRSRFPGELAEIRQVQDIDGIASPTRQRPLRYGDKVKQDELLAVVWSQNLGSAKANLVDAVCSLRLSEDALERAQGLFKEASLSLAALKQYERQVQADTNAILTAERSLRFWKLTEQEVQDIKAEARNIASAKKVRLLDDDMKWARVEIRAPKFKFEPGEPGIIDSHVELTVVEKNTNTNDMVDPTNSPPLMKLADLTRLQIWVQPPEEYLPLLRSQLSKGSRLKWKIQFQAYPTEDPLDLDVLQIAPSIDPNLRTPMVIGYLPNTDNKYLVGQFVTATIFVDPEPDTVEIPTMALNEVEGESLVFVEQDAGKREFILKRVAVAQRFKDVCYVRSVLTKRDEEISVKEQRQGRRTIRPLLAGEKVVTRGVLQMTVALETLLAKNRLEQEQAKQRVD